MVEFYQGQTYSPIDIADTDGILVLRSSNVQHGQVVSNDDVHIACTVKLADNVRRNDIIVVVRNGSRSLIGKHALIRRDMPNTVIGAFMRELDQKNRFSPTLYLILPPLIKKSKRIWVRPSTRLLVTCLEECRSWCPPSLSNVLLVAFSTTSTTSSPFISVSVLKYIRQT